MTPEDSEGSDSLNWSGTIRIHLTNAALCTRHYRYNGKSEIYCFCVWLGGIRFMPAVRNYPVYVGSKDVYYCALKKRSSNNRTTTTDWGEWDLILKSSKQNSKEISGHFITTFKEGIRNSSFHRHNKLLDQWIVVFLSHEAAFFQMADLINEHLDQTIIRTGLEIKSKNGRPWSVRRKIRSKWDFPHGLFNLENIAFLLHGYVKWDVELSSSLSHDTCR